ncbi:MAG: matrixin family metalloprotease, partial [Nanoarchaeota archaeon]|nr:matrixin family metalloprotease [Nanoarchaeota archaeon]
MKLRTIIILTIVMLMLSITVTASMLIPSSDKAKEHAKAPEKSPAIGDDWELERIDFVHYAKPDWAVKPPKIPKTETCYKLMGVKWKSFPVDYVINPTNNDGLSESFVVNTISTSAETWDIVTSSELFSDSYGIDYTVQYGVYDYQNSIVFGDYPESGVIGVTSVWYTRKGKEIVEFDMLLDTDFTWGDAELNTNLMDLENIMTHELGHAVGLSDLYSDACSAVTMYGYSNYGEISKRSLEQ